MLKYLEKHGSDMAYSAPESDGRCGIDFLHQGQMVAGKKSQNVPFYLPRRIQNKIILKKRCRSSVGHRGSFLLKNKIGSLK